METSDEINARMEEIYKSMSEEDIPWDRTDPPEILTDLVESGGIQPCKAIDIGCGTGTYSLYLASKGFDVTGVDVSKSAIRIAKNKAKAIPHNDLVQFLTANMLNNVSHIGGPFEFVIEWMILHHILPQDRDTYLKNICGLIKSGGKYLSVSFSEADKQFGIPPEGKIRKSTMGPTVYCAAIDELEDFFAPSFTILTKKITRIQARQGEHTVNHLLMEKL